MFIANSVNHQIVSDDRNPAWASFCSFAKFPNSEVQKRATVWSLGVLFEQFPPHHLKFIDTPYPYPFAEHRAKNSKKKLGKKIRKSLFQVYMYHTGSTAITNTIDIGFATTSIEFCPWNDYEVAVGVSGKTKPSLCLYFHSNISFELLGKIFFPIFSTFWRGSHLLFELIVSRAIRSITQSLSDATVNIYDTRYTKHQFMQLRGHRKAVSYVRYMDRGPGEHYLVSAWVYSFQLSSLTQAPTKF